MCAYFYVVSRLFGDYKNLSTAGNGQKLAHAVCLLLLSSHLTEETKSSPVLSIPPLTRTHMSNFPPFHHWSPTFSDKFHHWNEKKATGKPFVTLPLVLPAELCRSSEK